ncbi:caskin-1-like isoform X2 [Penaeus japonicus]|uniref:caskin-1-like isoform X2 n=1 Tax=Penaeus japonicus TaxID=27405 RepID=UPI001C714948|nr:caskin-1-like isoform X2 [Penaeus japonicus]
MLGRSSSAPLCRSASCKILAQPQESTEETPSDRERSSSAGCLHCAPKEVPEGGGRGGRSAKDDRCRRERPVSAWGVGYRSEADLPDAVAECFEDAPLLARLQTRLYSLVGRASRYRIHKGIAAPAMPLDALRRKVKEAKHRLLHPPPSPSPSSSSSSPPTTTKGGSTPDTPRYPPDSPASRLSSPGLITPCDTLGKRRRPQSPGGGGPAGGCSSLQHYWGGEAGGGEEEIELLQQYLNLQQLAVSRKHSAQLRRIRDSLLARVRSRPSSMIKVAGGNDVGCFTPSVLTSPAHTPAKDRQALRNFLLDIGFVQYYSLLNRHGYDLASAAHMDSLDLASVGITEPLHRMAVKYELDLVKQPPSIPEVVPETCQEWLTSLGLQEYVENFHQNGIYCPLAALGLSKRDLQVMGVYMLGHRKKILLAIAGLKEALLRKD